jgi:hypothetical protein
MTISPEALIGLLGVIIGAFVTIGWDSIQALWTRKKQRVYLAARVICILEDFIVGCTSVVKDDGEPDQDDCLHTQVPLPEINFTSLDVDWKVLPAGLMFEILSLPSKGAEAKRVIDATFFYAASPPDNKEGFDERHQQYSELGLIACNLSIKLRSKFKLPQSEYEDERPSDVFQTKIAKLYQSNERGNLSNQLNWD